MPLISVFTPAYNRAGKIHRVFNSLLNQTFKDFEWIIVDDGSTDNTKAVIESFRQAKPHFKISYLYQDNAGKHIAINQGVTMASGEWFHIADSDDELEPQTLMVFMNTWQEIPDENKDEFCGIVACCKDQFGKRISNKVPGGRFDGHLREMFYKNKFRNEFFHIYKTGIMKQFPFPVNIRNCYYTESFIWRNMTEEYKVRVISDELRIYYVNEESGALMSKKGRSPQSKAMANCIESTNILNYDLPYFIYYPVYFFKMAMLYHSFIPFLNKDQRQWVQLTITAKVFAFPFIFPGFIFSRLLNTNFKKSQ